MVYLHGPLQRWAIPQMMKQHVMPSEQMKGQGLYWLIRTVTGMIALNQGSRKRAGLKGSEASSPADQQTIFLCSLFCGWTNSLMVSGRVPTAGLLASLFSNPGLTR